MTIVNREHLVKYLGIGYQPGDVAKIFNVSPSYISQFLQEEGIVDEIRAARAKHNQAGMSIDENYTNIELAATGKILERVNQGFYKPTELVAVAVMANKASRKVGPQLDNAENGNGIASIRITLPAGMMGIEILRTPDNQVLKVGDVSLQPLAKQVVHEMAEAAIAKPKSLPKPEKHFEV